MLGVRVHIFILDVVKRLTNGRRNHDLNKYREIGHYLTSWSRQIYDVEYETLDSRNMSSVSVYLQNTGYIFQTWSPSVHEIQDWELKPFAGNNAVDFFLKFGYMHHITDKNRCHMRM